MKTWRTVISNFEIIKCISVHNSVAGTLNVFVINSMSDRLHLQPGSNVLAVSDPGQRKQCGCILKGKCKIVSAHYIPRIYLSAGTFTTPLRRRFDIPPPSFPLLKSPFVISAFKTFCNSRKSRLSFYFIILVCSTYLQVGNSLCNTILQNSKSSNEYVCIARRPYLK
jgi:hypothetical protein